MNTVQQTPPSTIGSIANATFDELLDAYEQTQPRSGQYLEGQVIRIQDDALFVDVGAKRTAIVPSHDMRELDEAYLTGIGSGDTVPVYVEHTPVGSQSLIVSLRRGLEHRDWRLASEQLESGETTEREVVGYNKGGLMVQFGRIQGFVPNSHVPDLKFNAAQSDKARMVGSMLAVKVLEVDLDRKRLVLSGRAAMQEKRRALLEALEVGTVVTGTVVNLAKFGAFVNIGELTGLVHISKIAWQPVSHPSDVLQEGQEIEVRIDKVDMERERISLNRKALLPDPWDVVGRTYEPGDRVEGVVTNVVDFGVFVRVPQGVEGLVHVSELNTWQAADPAGSLQRGDIVLAAIVDVDVVQERLGLSLKRVSYEEELAWIQQQEKPEIVA